MAELIEFRTCIKTEKRILYGIEVQIVDPEYLAVFVSPATEPKESCCELFDLKSDWLSAKAGDFVLLRRTGENLWEKRSIKLIKLFRVSPARYCDQVVTCAQEWLSGVNGTPKSHFGPEGTNLPCDKRGYVPNPDALPFDLEWEFEQDTHYFDGHLTEYGKWFAFTRWPEILDEMARFRREVAGSALSDRQALASIRGGRTQI